MAIIKGTKAETVSNVLYKLNITARMKVKEVTLDMANNMDWIVRAVFPNSSRVTDRFHVQKLVTEALQEVRIKERWKTIDEENEAIQKCKKKKQTYKATTYFN